MRRYLIMIFFLFSAAACLSSTISLTQPEPTITLTAPPATLTPIPATASPTITTTPTSTPLPPSPSPTASQAPESEDGGFTVLFHPDDVLYVGDQVSFEVISPTGVDLKDASLQVQVDPPSDLTLGPVSFSAWGIQGRQEASLVWAWDTTDLAPGLHDLVFTVLPQGDSWSEQVILLPADEIPPALAQARWDSIQTDCCTVFYITHTASERDLATLAAQVDAQASLSIEEMDASFTEPITITVLPRLLGHGGFTSSEISVSYLDRNYAGNSWETVVHHEMIHVIDALLGGDFRPTIFVEGLAVYEAGGHYKPEPLMSRAAALLEDNLNWYIPLRALTDDFYASQHEIGYLEGGSLIEYMVNTYGWEAFSTFYRDIHIQEGEKQSDALDAALKVHFSISLDDLEAGYLASLAAQPDAVDWLDDVRLTVTFFDTMRRYQQLLDPSAYFRTAWLMDNPAMRERGIVADYLRHPNSLANLALETLLITASQQVSDQQFSAADQTLASINSVLDALEQGSDIPFSVSPVAADYLAISATLEQHGAEVQRITLDGDSAAAWGTNASGPNLNEYHLARTGAGWALLPNLNFVSVVYNGN